MEEQPHCGCPAQGHKLGSSASASAQLGYRRHTLCPRCTRPHRSSSYRRHRCSTRLGCGSHIDHGWFFWAFLGFDSVTDPRGERRQSPRRPRGAAGGACQVRYWGVEKKERAQYEIHTPREYEGSLSPPRWVRRQPMPAQCLLALGPLSRRARSPPFRPDEAQRTRFEDHDLRYRHRPRRPEAQ